MNLPPGRVNWQLVTWVLLHKCRLRPWEIRKLTLAEISLYLDGEGDKPRPEQKGEAVSHEEILRRAERRHRMTPRERLEEARGVQPRQPGR